MLVTIMHTVTSALQGPVIILLLVLGMLMIVLLGMLVAEFFTERRYFKLSIPDLVDDLQHSDDPEAVVRESGMLRRQKAALFELLNHPDATSSERESMAVNIVAQEKAIFDNRVKVTDLIAKIGPMLGLMGTLIPLGPGVIAIGVGDTQTLSDSLLVAFDTTVTGLLVAGLAVLISTIRKAWYAKYNAAFAAACEIVLEKANEGKTLAAPIEKVGDGLETQRAEQADDPDETDSPTTAGLSDVAEENGASIGRAGMPVDDELARVVDAAVADALARAKAAEQPIDDSLAKGEDHA